jgi:hypothetical protein
MNRFEDWESWAARLTDADFAAFNQSAWAEAFTDGLPLAVPTPERVAAVLGTIPPDRPVGRIPVRRRPVTARDVAVQGAMAGLRAEALGIVIAALEAMGDPAFNLLGIGTTTGSATPAVVVSGPVRRRAGIQCGANALGPGPWANGAVGRTIRLVLQNLGGLQPGTVDMATLGQPGKFTFCFGENTEESPWPGFAVARGFGADDDVVTVVGVAGSVEVVSQADTDPEDLLLAYALAGRAAGSLAVGGTTLGSGQIMVILPPEAAMILDRAGWTRADAQAFLYETLAVPVEALAPGQRRLLEEARRAAGIAAEPVVRAASSPEDVLVVVAGGTGIKGAVLPTWGAPTRAVSRALDPVLRGG